MYRRFLLVAVVIATLFLTQPVYAQSTLISIGDPVGTISKWVYGANYGPWAVLSLDMFPKAVESGVTYLRFPAGNWGDQNDLTEFHLKMLTSLMKAGKMDATVCVRWKGGTPEKAAQMVRWLNVEQKLGLTHWCIGNEPDLYEDVTPESIQKYNTLWREIALAMRAVDPSILFVGPEVSQFPVKLPAPDYMRPRYDWVREFLKVNGDLVSVVTVHRYPFPSTTGGPPPTIAEMRASVAEWDTLIPTLRTLIKETLGRDLPIGVTEVNSHWSNTVGGDTGLDSFYHSIWWAGVLGKLIEQRVDMANFFVLSNNDGWGLLTRYEPRTAYYVFQLYKRFGTTQRAVKHTDNELVVTAAQRADGKLTVMVVNLGDQGKQLALSVNGKPLSSAEEVWRLDDTLRAESPTGSALTNALQLSVPRHSVTLYVFVAP
jgi:hypothetical protein